MLITYLYCWCFPCFPRDGSSSLWEFQSPLVLFSSLSRLVSCRRDYSFEFVVNTVAIGCSSEAVRSSGFCSRNATCSFAVAVLIAIRPAMAGFLDYRHLDRPDQQLVVSGRGRLSTSPRPVHQQSFHGKGHARRGINSPSCFK